MKLLLDFLPLILFFIVFKVAEGHADVAAAFATQHFGFLVQGGVVGAQEAPVLLATLVVMVATLAQAALLKLRGKKIDLMLWISLVMVVTLGAATVWFHNETFIKWKPTGLYWATALVLWTSQAWLGKNLVKSMLGAEMELPEDIWLTLNRASVLFFAAMGVVNLYVAYNFSTSAWANFKVFGATGLMVAFFLGVGLYASKYMPPEEDGKT
jgi:intracellular septation protein